MTIIPAISIHNAFCENCLLTTSISGPTKIDLNVSESETASAHHGDLQPGGTLQPHGCISRHRVDIVIPYRDRWSHLRVLLHFLISVLQRNR